MTIKKSESSFRTFIANNVRAFFIHGVVIVVCAILAGLAVLLDFALVDRGIDFPPFLGAFGLLGMLAAYIYLGSRFLQLPRRGLILSVAALPIVLILIFEILFRLGQNSDQAYEGSAHAIVTLINLPSMYVAMMAYSLLQPASAPDSFLPVGIVYFASILPPLLMMLGLFIRMIVQDRQEQKNEPAESIV